MREQPVDTIEYRGFEVKIYQDMDAEDPRDWDNIGHMACTHRDYHLGDKEFQGKDGDEVVEKILAAVTDENKASMIRDTWGFYGTSSFVDKGLYIISKLAPVILPLYLLDHSGLQMKAGSNGVSYSRRGAYECDAQGWDTSMVGFIFCTWDDVKRENGLGKDAVEKAEKYLRGEVETYSQYLEGSVYGYMIEPKDGNRVECDDGCWGFYGYDWKENGLLEMAKGSIDDAIEKYRQEARKLHVEKLQTRKFFAECWAD